MIRSRHRFLVQAFLGFLVALSPETPASAQQYGYKKEKDPLILGVKKAIAEARAGRTVELKKTVNSLTWQVAELKRDVRVDLESQITDAVSSGKTERVAYALTHLVFQATRQKFYWNLHEGLAKPVPARARLDAAQFYYEEILSHAVRRSDSSENTSHHRKIMVRFRGLRKTLGTTGLFGLGSRKPDPKGMKTLSDEILALLLKVYPNFTVSSPPPSTNEDRR